MARDAPGMVPEQVLSILQTDPGSAQAFAEGRKSWTRTSLSPAASRALSQALLFIRLSRLPFSSNTYSPRLRQILTGALFESEEH
jgi:hypothetical protein